MAMRPKRLKISNRSKIPLGQKADIGQKGLIASIQVPGPSDSRFVKILFAAFAFETQSNLFIALVVLGSIPATSKLF